MNLHRTNLLVMHADPIVCAGVVATLRQHGACNVVERATGQCDPQGPGVDIVIADYSTALCLANAELRQSLGLPAGARILALTPNDREVDIRRAIEVGVHGYVLLGGALGELANSVTALASGLRYMSPSVTHRMAESLTHEALTSRELQVLNLVAAGKGNKAIARELDITVGTVKSHVSAIIGKLGAHSRTQAVSIADARGLINEHKVEVQPIPTGGCAQRIRLLLN